MAKVEKGGAYLRDTMVFLSLDRVERVVASDMRFC